MMRMVTHYGISSEDIDYTLVALQEHFPGGGGGGVARSGFPAREAIAKSSPLIPKGELKGVWTRIGHSLQTAPRCPGPSGFRLSPE